MNEQLQDTLNQFLIDMIGALEQTGEWIAGQIPLVIQEIIVWNIVYNLVLFVVGLLLIPILVKLHLLFIQQKHEWQKELWELTGGAHLMAFIVTVVLSLGVINNTLNLTWLKAWVAPRLFLLEYAQTLVQGAS